MDAKKREIRTVDCELRVREAAPGSEAGESRTIEGTAIVFNAESQVLDDWGTRFREVIKPEACSMEFLNSQDIKMNMLHDRQLTVARNNKNAANATLHLSVDEHGVNFEFEAPKCDIGDRCLEMVRRGDYSGCSFEFYPQDYDIEENGKEVKITHTKFRALLALTIGLDPAYVQTSVNARELAEGKESRDQIAAHSEEERAARPEEKKVEEEEEKDVAAEPQQTEPEGEAEPEDEKEEEAAAEPEEDKEEGREQDRERERELAEAQRLQREREMDFITYFYNQIF